MSTVKTSDDWGSVANSCTIAGMVDDEMGDRPEVVVGVGAEGGSLTLLRQLGPDGAWRYYMERDEGSLEEFCDFEMTDEEKFSRTGEVATFEEGLALMDTYPEWCRLCPLEIHPEFREAVLAVVVGRLDREPKDQHDCYSLENWMRVAGAERD